MLEITEGKEGQVTVLGLKGRLDVGSSKTLGDRLLKVMEAETKLVLDLSELDYISSSGLQVLLLAAIRAKDSKRSIILASMKPQVKQVLDYAGFAGVFKITESVKQATDNP